VTIPWSQLLDQLADILLEARWIATLIKGSESAALHWKRPPIGERRSWSAPTVGPRPISYSIAEIACKVDRQLTVSRISEDASRNEVHERIINSPALSADEL
jgi:hypothetical protein